MRSIEKTKMRVEAFSLTHFTAEAEAVVVVMSWSLSNWCNQQVAARSKSVRSAINWSVCQHYFIFSVDDFSVDEAYGCRPYVTFRAFAEFFGGFKKYIMHSAA